MDSFNKTNLQNIKDIFEEKTGVALETRRRRQPIRAAMLVAAVLVCSLTMTAFAVSLFSSLSGDDLSLSATYEGNGIVTIQVANKSDKDLSFQRQLKLMRWSTGKEVEPVSDTIVFDGTEFEAHTNGVMTVDLSKAYDMDFLEQPLADDNYYFVLTNNNFMFGQDWMCFVTFAEPIKTVVDDPIPVTPVEADKELVAQIMEELQPYFENYYTDIADRRNHADNYLVKCQELLATLDRDIVASEASPLAIDGLNPDVVFDKTAPLETQHWLTGLHEHTLDGYGIPVGSAEGESALVLSAYVPQHKGEVDGGAEVPLLYFFTYSVDDIQSPEDYAFIHGQIITFEQLEQYKVYEDDQYVCYEVTDLFYTNLRQHVESIISQRSDIYFDEQVWERVENIYTYYKDRDVLASRFYYNVPVEYGYIKNPDDPRFWVIDPEAADVVRRIYDMALEGYGLAEIATALGADGIVNPTYYWRSKGVNRSGSKSTLEPTKWGHTTVKKILTLQEYCGDVINFKSYSKSYKMKRRIENPEENRAIFLNVHEPIIDRVTWEKVQALQKGTRRKKPTVTQEPSVFSGRLKCPECGGNLNFHFNQKNQDIKFFSCQNHNSGLRKCSATHYIRLDFLEQVVLYEVNRLATFANEYERDFVKAMMGRSAKVAENDRARKQRELNTLLTRDKELDMLFERLYEDNVAGKIDDTRFARMSKRYEQEQGEIGAKVKTLRLELKKAEGQQMDMEDFLETVRRYTHVTKITRRMVSELIDHIDVYHAEKQDGVTNQQVVIHYNCIGAFEVPDRKKIPEADIIMETRKGVAVSYAPAQIAV